jgi:hypothetical integral membrane protein (TIGR02206 family)
VACLFALASQPTPPFDTWRQFHAFSLTHAFALAAFLILCTAILAIGMRMRGDARQARFERALGSIGLIIWTVANVYVLLPGVFGWDWALPLHVCDLCALIAPVVVMQARPAAWQRSMLYFWGIGLCTQAFITPTLREGPADPQFWCFWSAHFVILIFALYDIIVRRWRPTWRHWTWAVALSIGYLALILPIDIIFDWNYGFIGRETKADTMIEALGPWPARVIVIFCLSVLAYTGLMLPWRSPIRVLSLR